MKTHFSYDDEITQAQCGTWLGGFSNTSHDWTQVDCRACLKQKAKIIAIHNVQEAAIVAQMGDMADFMRNQPQENDR